MLDVATIQKDIKDVEKVVDKLDQLIPGQVGVRVREYIGRLEKAIDNSPVIVEIIAVIVAVAEAGGKLDKATIIKLLEDVFLRHGL